MAVKPSASTTGAAILADHPGDLIVTAANAVIEDLDIRGFVEIAAPNVQLRGCRIHGGPTSTNRALLKITSSKATGFVVDSCTLEPDVPNVHIDGVRVNQPGVLSRLDISGTVDGVVMFGDGIVLRDSWLHDFVTFDSDPNQGGGMSHSDGVMLQSGDSIRITGNAISGAINSAIILTQDAGAVTNLLIDGNWLSDGAVSVNLTPKAPIAANNSIINNRFGLGPAVIRRASTCRARINGNVIDATGQPIAILNG